MIILSFFFLVLLNYTQNLIILLFGSEIKETRMYFKQLKQNCN